MKVATWNVNGIRARQQQFADWVEQEQPDIICLQEIKASPAQVPVALQELSNYKTFWHGSGGYSGVSLHIKTSRANSETIFEHPTFDYESRMVQAQIGKVMVASVYVPNGGKDFAAKMNFLSALHTYVREIHTRGLELLLCGDLNIARTPIDVHPSERRPVIGQLPHEREALENILAEGLMDVGRMLDPENDRLFTWWAPWRGMRQKNIGWRLDYILASDKLAKLAINCQVQREVGTSDHGPVVATFSDL